jgi:hypothetical protein
MYPHIQIKSVWDPGSCQVDEGTFQLVGRLSAFAAREKQLAGLWVHIFLQLGHSLSYARKRSQPVCLDLGVVPLPGLVVALAFANVATRSKFCLSRRSNCLHCASISRRRVAKESTTGVGAGAAVWALVT